MINIKYRGEIVKIGQHVRYIRTGEMGRIKSFSGRYAWVVYKCNNKWDNFKDYTAQATLYKDLKFL